jgi:hypothetical protein
MLGTAKKSCKFLTLLLLLMTGLTLLRSRLRTTRTELKCYISLEIVLLCKLEFQDVRTGVRTFLIIHFTEPPTKDDREGRVVEMIKQAPAPGTFTQGEKRSQAQLQSF